MQHSRMAHNIHTAIQAWCNHYIIIIQYHKSHPYLPSLHSGASNAPFWSENCTKQWAKIWGWLILMLLLTWQWGACMSPCLRTDATRREAGSLCHQLHQCSSSNPWKNNQYCIHLANVQEEILGYKINSIHNILNIANLERAIKGIFLLSIYLLQQL